MGQALYRKYRSTTMSEVLGQEHITTALQQAIDTGRISHAYLFTGPRGTGKTSIARILANAINGLPYSTDPHLDIIEIDAASNRRIDEIRDLRDKVYVAPTSAKYKVYIIDEVHMLTREAFNALLKTLEEPPAHVVFILATTDAHKLPETIVSRTQRYNFRPVDADQVAAHLANIAKKEHISIDKASLQLLAEHGEGSFRDSISMLDQVSNHADSITVEIVRQQLGIPPETAIDSLMESLSSDDISVPVQTLQTLYDQGFRGATIAEQLSARLRQLLANNSLAMPPATALTILRQLLEVAGSHSPERRLELVLMQAIVPTEPIAPIKAAAPVKRATQQDAPKVTEEPVAKPKTGAKTAKTNEVTEVKQPKTAKHGAQSSIDETAWIEVLAALKKQYNTIYGIVRMAHTDFSEPGKVSLQFAFAFHQKRITDPKNRKIVADTIEQVTGQRVELVCSLSKEPKARSAAAAVSTTAKKPADDALQDISSVFGGAELL